ncbi:MULTISPECIES: L,D-transpeptidase family protein [unclassified Moraxella]|uniref:L,D-transpeptidase family protein n=1 Tax=unclassified Moraxella TaxID=2685852 RepID=UPI003AF843E2
MPFFSPMFTKSSSLLLLCMALPLTLTACQRSDTDKSTLTSDTTASAPASTVASTPVPVLRPNVSQQFVGTSPIEVRLAYALPEIPYTTDNLPSFAQTVNQASWGDSSDLIHSMTASQSASTANDFANTSSNQLSTNLASTTPASSVSPVSVDNTKITKKLPAKLDQATIIKIQALLNWHNHGVGAVNGKMSRNVIKAMNVFQQKHNLAVTSEMDEATWKALTSDEKLNQQPVLINYTLTKDDVHIPYHTKGMQYTSVREAVAERFHMSRSLLSQLNPDTPLKVGNTITVYNPYQPNMTEITKVVANKKRNLLYAYDKTGRLVASYPTTVGSQYTPSPSGTLKVINRVINPTYNKDFSNKDSVLPPGPNNPVGRVWIGLSKKSFGIHGSPEPEMISQQKSHGCVRLTNWDALALYGTIADGAEVIFE